MKRIAAIFTAVIAALTMGGLLGASYGVFSPGGALSGTWNSQNVNLGAGGSFITGVTPFANGGTNLATAADDTTIVSSGSAWVARTLPDCVDSAGNHLNYTQSTNLFSCGTSSSGGGGTPGGATTNVQYNNAGAFGGSTAFSFDSATNLLTLGVTATEGILQGAVPAATVAGGRLTLRGGPGGATSGNGGPITLAGGIPVDGIGGSITLTGQAGVGTNRNGGSITAQAGAATGSAAGGNVTNSAGAGGATGTPGTYTMSGGAGGSTSGNGGDGTIRGGLPVDGNGGSVNITARDGIGTNRSGGNVVITLGALTGSGTVGSLQFVGGTTTGAQTATFIATNKPGAATGAPTLWLRVVVSGTTFWIPLFAN